jgi:hypothetical protein
VVIFGVLFLDLVIGRLRKVKGTVTALEKGKDQFQLIKVKKHLHNLDRI